MVLICFCQIHFICYENGHWLNCRFAVQLDCVVWKLMSWIYTHPRNMFPPPNVWHEFQNEIENAGFYTHQRNRFIPPKFFAWIYRIELKVWILYTCRKFVSTPQMFGTNFGIELKKFYTHPRKMYIPLNVLHDYQDIVERVGFYTHTRNMFQPPKCLAWILGKNWKCWDLYTSQKYVLIPTNV